MVRQTKASGTEKKSDDARAVGYLRTSSAANVGEDKDSHQRQRREIEAFAKARGLKVEEWFYDPAVSGDDAVTDRPGFTAMLDYLEGSGVRTVLVEDASRFARKMLAAELGILAMIERKTRVLTKSGDDLTETDDEMKIAMRQIAMAFAQLEKTRLVKKLRGARDRKSAELGRRIEGRKGYADTKPELVALARKLARKNPRTGKARTLREVAEELAKQGHVTAGGKAFSAGQVQRLIKRT